MVLLYLLAPSFFEKSFPRAVELYYEAFSNMQKVLQKRQENYEIICKKEGTKYTMQKLQSHIKLSKIVKKVVHLLLMIAEGEEYCRFPERALEALNTAAWLAHIYFIELQDSVDLCERVEQNLEQFRARQAQDLDEQADIHKILGPVVHREAQRQRLEELKDEKKIDSDRSLSVDYSEHLYKRFRCAEFNRNKVIVLKGPTPKQEVKPDVKPRLNQSQSQIDRVKSGHKKNALSYVSAGDTNLTEMDTQAELKLSTNASSFRFKTANLNASLPTSPDKFLSPLLSFDSLSNAPLRGSQQLRMSQLFPSQQSQSQLLLPPHQLSQHQSERVLEVPAQPARKYSQNTNSQRNSLVSKKLSFKDSSAPAQTHKTEPFEPKIITSTKCNASCS